MSVMRLLGYGGWSTFRDGRTVVDKRTTPWRPYIHIYWGRPLQLGLQIEWSDHGDSGGLIIHVLIPCLRVHCGVQHGLGLHWIWCKDLW